MIKVVNHIKSNSRQDHLSLEFCNQNWEECVRLVLHTEVRLLSKRNCLQHFFALLDSMVSFLANTELGEQMFAIKCHVSNLSDIFEKLNVLDEQLQGRCSDLMPSKSALTAFLRRLQFYKNNIRHRTFWKFPCLAPISSDLHDKDHALYSAYLENMHKDMQTRLSNLLIMDIPTSVTIPSDVNVADTDISLQEPIIELQSDEILCARFKDWMYNMENKWYC